MKQLLAIFSIVFCFCSCTSKYAVEGNTAMPNLDGKTAFLKVYLQNQWLTVDSAEIIHGSFKMKGHTDTIVLANLYIDDESVMPLVLENGKIKISLEFNRLSAEGTRMNDLLYTFLDKRNEIENRLRELERSEARLILEGRDLDEVKTELSQKNMVMTQEMRTLIKSFIVDNGENVLGPYVFMLLATSLPYPIITPQIEDIMNDAPYSLKNNYMVKEFMKTAKENMERIKEQQRLQQASPSGNK